MDGVTVLSEFTTRKIGGLEAALICITVVLMFVYCSFVFHELFCRNLKKSGKSNFVVSLIAILLCALCCLCFIADTYKDYNTIYDECIVTVDDTVEMSDFIKEYEILDNNGTEIHVRKRNQEVIICVSIAKTIIEVFMIWI